MIAAGVVGMNLEDATGDPAHPLVDLPVQLERIRAVKAAALKTGILLVLNARTDVYLAKVGRSLLRATTSRRGGYWLTVTRVRTAFFCRAWPTARRLRRIVRDVECPVNILVGPGSPTIAELQRSRRGASEYRIKRDARDARVGETHCRRTKKGWDVYVTRRRDTVRGCESNA